MLKRVAGGALFVSAIFALLWYMGLKTLFVPIVSSPTAQEAGNTNSSVHVDGVSPQSTSSSNTTDPSQTLSDSSALHLALQSIDLLQGEGGLALWRLHASYANIRQEDGKVIIEKPKLLYFIGEKNEDSLCVISDRGEIEQEKRILKFINNVTAEYKDSKVTGQLLNYIDEQKIMQFPENAVFTGRGIYGTADAVTWHMKQKTIDAQGRVKTIFSRSARKSAPQVTNATI